MLGWAGGDDKVPFTCTHVGRYARCWVWVRGKNVPCNCAHVGCYARRWVGVGGMITFLAFAHVLDATQDAGLGWGDDNFPCICTHVGCYATAIKLSQMVKMWNVAVLKHETTAKRKKVVLQLHVERATRTDFIVKRGKKSHCNSVKKSHRIKHCKTQRFNKTLGCKTLISWGRFPVRRDVCGFWGLYYVEGCWTIKHVSQRWRKKHLLRVQQSPGSAADRR